MIPFVIIESEGASVSMNVAEYLIELTRVAQTSKNRSPPFVAVSYGQGSNGGEECG